MGNNTVIDLFSGAGGLSEGFRQAGFHVLAGNDFDQYAAETYKVTHPEATFVPGPIQEISGSDFLKAANLRRGELHCLVGGPPCQAFSVYNHQRGMHDERSGLFKEYLRIVSDIFPEWVVMENVTGMTSVEDGKAVSEIKRGLSELGYHDIDTRVLKAEEYGVPQERRRLVFLANRKGKKITWPSISHDGVKKPFVTIGDAILDLPELENGEGEEIQNYPFPLNESTAYQRMMRVGSKKVVNHVAPSLSKINLERMNFIPQGGSWRDLPIELLPAGMKQAKRSDHTKRYGRMKIDGQSCTILTKCDIHWGAFIHPTQNRSITVREAARIQSFPDKFIFLGPKTEQYRQVGNAVPPLLAKAVAKHILDIDSQGTSRKKAQIELA